MTLADASLPIATIAVTLTAIIGAAFGYLLLVVVKRRFQGSYDDVEHRAMLSAMRANSEAQIAKLMAELTQSEARWREANHLILDGQGADPRSQSSTALAKNPFLRGLGIDAGSVEPDDHLVFVLTPFSEDQVKTFRWIKQTCDRIGFHCVRGDEVYTSSNILSHIVQLIARARIIIANVGTRNPNVFYELGIAHSLGKEVILISENVSDIPFDLQGNRVIIFDNQESLDRELSDAIVRAIADRKKPSARQNTELSSVKFSHQLYVGDLRVWLRNIEKEHYIEIDIRAFNGSEYEIKVDKIDGSILYLSDMHSDAPIQLPRPGALVDGNSQAAPYAPLNIVVRQPVPPSLVGRFTAEATGPHGVQLDLRNFDINITTAEGVSARLPVWPGVITRVFGDNTSSNRLFFADLHATVSVNSSLQ